MPCHATPKGIQLLQENCVANNTEWNTEFWKWQQGNQAHIHWAVQVIANGSLQASVRFSNLLVLFNGFWIKTLMQERE